MHLDMIYAFGAGQRKPPVEADSDERNCRLVLSPAAPGFRKLEQTPAAEAGRHGTRLFNHQWYMWYMPAVPRLIAGGEMK